MFLSIRVTCPKLGAFFNVFCVYPSTFGSSLKKLPDQEILHKNSVARSQVKYSVIISYSDKVKPIYVSILYNITDEDRQRFQ
jgi:hypothetical protein